MQIIEITHKMLIPDGYEFMSYWYPEKGDEYINAVGEVLVCRSTFQVAKYHIIKKISK